MFKKASIVTLAAATIAVSAAPAQAQQDINPWQECGIGAMVFPDNGTAAAISNIIWDLGTTAVTSQMSSPESCEGSGVRTAMFIQRTYDELEVDTAKGEGRYLTAATELMGCDASVRPAIISDVRSDLSARAKSDEFSNMSRTEKAEQYYMSLSAASKGQCIG